MRWAAWSGTEILDAVPWLVVPGAALNIAQCVIHLPQMGLSGRFLNDAGPMVSISVSLLAGWAVWFVVFCPLFFRLAEWYGLHFGRLEYAHGRWCWVEDDRGAQRKGRPLGGAVEPASCGPPTGENKAP